VDFPFDYRFIIEGSSRWQLSDKHRIVATPEDGKNQE
jgi:hypothetical protein